MIALILAAAAALVVGFLLSEFRSRVAGTRHTPGVRFNDIIGRKRIESALALEAGTMEVEVVDFDLRLIVEDAARLVAPRAAGKGLELSVIVDADTPTMVRGDAGRIREVLVNMLSNAVKFTEMGGIGLRIRITEDRSDTAVVRFEVVDTGIGVRPEQLACLYESFTQGDAAATRRSGGTGLGLAICKELVEGMGGEVGATSEPRKGSTFWFELALAKAAGAAAPSGPHDPVPDGAQALATPHLEDATGPSDTEAPLTLLGRLLVVDDNPVNQRVALRMLEKRGHNVDVADNGIEALARVAVVDYQAILMDCQMPEMDGFAATREIRRREGTHRHTPIIAMTAGAMKHDKQKCLSAGMDAYLSKPIKADTLGAMVDRWTAGWLPPDAVRDPGPRPGSLLDPGLLAELRDLGPAEFGHLVALFLTDGAGRIAEMRVAVASGDAVTVARLAQGLRGSSLTLGAGSLALHCGQLQMLAAQGELAAAGHLLDVIAAEFTPVSAALRDAVAGDPAVR